MKIHRLEVEGFGPFLHRQVVDFDAFDADGIFLISGKTGAGKSSILDAVCFALYATVPRYEDGDRRLRSDHCLPEDPTLVSLEFDAAGETWRVERSPEYERPKKRGDGTTPQPAQAKLFRWVDGRWQGEAARAVDVGVRLGEILGLSATQFQQVILLAQNRFARFLLAKNDERQRLLRTLFDSERFDRYEQSLEARRKAAAELIELETRALDLELDTVERLAAESGIELDLPQSAMLAERLAAAATAASRARYLVETSAESERVAESGLAAASADHTERVAQAEQQAVRDRSRVVLTRLEADAAAIAEARDLFARATAAEALRGVMDAARRALSALTAAVADEKSARVAWLDAGEVDADAAGLAGLADALWGEVGQWRAVLEAERGIAALEADVARATADLADLDARIATGDESRRAIPALVDALDSDIRDAATAAAGLDDAERRVAELDAQAAAAAEAESRAMQLRSAETAALEAGARMRAASAHLDSLRERRMLGYAGELAAGLADGEPCAVCGSTDHPDPAPRAGDPVTPESIASAEATKDAAVAAEGAASTVLRAAQSAHADAAVRAGARDLGELAVAAEAARAAFATATAARVRLALLEADRTDAELRRTAAGAEAEQLAAVRAEAATLVATRTQRLAHDAGIVEAARGEHPTVAARIAETEARIARARALEKALGARANCADAAEVAADALGRRLDESDFADVAEAQSALRDATARSALDARVREHDSALAAERATLMRLAMAALPEEPVDTTQSAAALLLAEHTWKTAVSARAAAVQRSSALTRAHERATAAHESIASAAAERETIDRLANTVAGRAPNTRRMKLEAFVLAAELEDIVVAANGRLAEMSNGRFSLQHTDALAGHGRASGLGLEVMDRHTGRARSPQSLSGGETFLASLALALGLAEVVTSRAGGIRLDTLFIDEGFGSLDSDTLEIAMRTLDELRQGGRTVGVISHVEAMKDSLPAHLTVEATLQGWSVVTQAAASLPVR